MIRIRRALPSTDSVILTVASLNGLEVTQPELHGTSMTALRRAYLATEVRERISLLNLRHSLSTALVALHATGHARRCRSLNVNRLLATGLTGAFA